MQKQWVTHTASPSTSPVPARTLYGCTCNQTVPIIPKSFYFNFTEFGVCKCWGDPHCESFDKRVMHFQGACQYTLARDGCTDGIPTGEPTFHVVQDNWREYEETDKEVSWAKEIYLLIYGHVSTTVHVS